MPWGCGLATYIYIYMHMVYGLSACVTFFGLALFIFLSWLAFVWATCRLDDPLFYSPLFPLFFLIFFSEGLDQPTCVRIWIRGGLG